MLFPTLTFIFGFLPLTLVLFFLLAAKNHKLSRCFLIVASFVFYSWFNWSYAFILAGSLLMNWFFASLLYRKSSKITLTIGILCNVLLLGYFKYYDFFVGNINVLFGTSFVLKHILLPLGISFFTFQQISFLQLVYSGSLAKRYSFETYALFVSFFPQLIAGPIVLPDEMMSQFDKKECFRPQYRNIAAGLYVFALGMAKKILLADYFAEIADPGFVNAAGNFFAGWKTALAYTFQIYFDFSGYCDMAMGIGKWFNIDLPLNFNSPYKSADFQSFWRRWHITLGRFMMNYLYIPLGGNKKGMGRTLCNLFVVFVLSGIWHGAGWLFLIWGGLHGAGILINRFWRKAVLVRWPGIEIPRIPAVILTFLTVNLLWVFFRAATLKRAWEIIESMFDFSHIAWITKSFRQGIEEFGFECGSVFAVCFFAALLTFVAPNSFEMDQRLDSRPRLRMFLTVLFAVCGFLCVGRVSPFLYFNF